MPSTTAEPTLDHDPERVLFIAEEMENEAENHAGNAFRDYAEELMEDARTLRAHHARAQRIEAALCEALGAIETLTHELNQWTKGEWCDLAKDDVARAIANARAALES